MHGRDGDLLGHHVRAHRVLDVPAVEEGEVVALKLGLGRPRGDVPGAGGAVVAGGDDGVGVDELHLGDPVIMPGAQIASPNLQILEA